jgi:hypothetical protein
VCFFVCLFFSAWCAFIIVLNLRCEHVLVLVHVIVYAEINCLLFVPSFVSLQDIDLKNQNAVDDIMLKLDGTPNKGKTMGIILIIFRLSLSLGPGSAVVGSLDL